MKTSLVLTVLGTDRTGLVRTLADLVAAHGGNWLESRMARLAGQFAGIVRIECPADRAEELAAKLTAPNDSGLTVLAVREESPAVTGRRTLAVEVIGNDRPGIVSELTAAVALTGGNIEELTTNLESAPMSGHPMFRARGVISVPEDADIAVVAEAIGHLGGDLTVDVTV